MKKGGGNISIKLTNILKQTQECCNKKKCPKGSKRCKPSKKKRKKDDDQGLFGGMPNIKPTSRAIPMPQSVMNNITPVPNIPMPRQLPAYSQFRRPHAMYQRNDRPLQVQQGRGVRQPERQPLMVSTGIQTARRQAIARPRQAIAQRRINRLSQQLPPISVQSGIRGQGIIATQAPKQLKKQELTTQQLQPINIQSQRQGLTTQLLQPININPTKTRAVISDNQIRGSQGTADQPFNAPVPTPNILDIDAIRMRNEEQDRREVARDLVQMREKRIEGTIEDIGKGTPREADEEKEEERPSSPEVIFSDVTDDESDEALDNQIEGVERLIAQEQDVAMAQGQSGFVRDQREQINERETRPQIDDIPTRGTTRGRPSKKDQAEVARRREFFRENDMENFYDYTHNEVLNEDMSKYDYNPQSTPSSDIRDYARIIRPAGVGASSFV